MRGGVRRALAAGVLVLAASGCATFPDNGPLEWQEQLDGVGQLGGIPRVPEESAPSGPLSGESAAPTAPTAPQPCVDPDPAVVATCLNPVGAVAVLPDGETAFVGERATGRVLRAQQGTTPEEILTLPVDATGGGGLTGLALSPSFAEDRLAYAYVTTPEDNRVVLIAGTQTRPLLTGIPRGSANNGGALAFDVDGSLLVATGDAGGPGADPASLAGKVLRVDAQGRPAPDNPDPTSPILSSGLQAPGGVCVNPASSAVWVTDRRTDADALHQLVPGPLPAPAWRWPDRPGVGGCAAQQDPARQEDIVAVAQAGTASLTVLRTARSGPILGMDITLTDAYGRLTAATLAPDGLIWVGTANKDGGSPVPSDDRVIRLPPMVQGGASPV